MDPKTLFLQHEDGLGQIIDPAKGNMLHGAGRGLGHGGIEGDGSPPGNDHGVHACTISNPEDGTQIVGILNLVQKEEEGGTVCRLAGGQDLVQFPVVEWGHFSDDALVTVTFGQGIKPGPAGVADQGTLLAAGLNQVGEVLA